MITLIQYPRAKNLPNASPFCLKMETFLKVAGVPYDTKLTVSTAKTKRKKLPVILEDGLVIEDSTLIIEHLRKKHGIDLDKNLTDEQRALATAYKLVCEKSIVDIIMWFRWCDPVNWPKFRDVIFAGVPWLVKATIANSVAKKVSRTLWAHGIGRYTDEERMAFLHENLKSISTYLGQKKYFFGDQPTTIDCILFGHLAQLDRDKTMAQTQDILRQYPNLKTYVDHIFKTYWNEYAL